MSNIKSQEILMNQSKLPRRLTYSEIVNFMNDAHTKNMAANSVSELYAQVVSVAVNSFNQTEGTKDASTLTENKINTFKDSITKP